MNSSAGPADTAGPLPTGPSRLWYVLACCLIAGAAASIALGAARNPASTSTSLSPSDVGQLLSSFDQQINSLQRVPAPGQGEVTFTQPGPYTLYIEGPGDSSDPMGMPSYSAWSMHASLRPQRGGPPVPMSTQSDSASSYNGTQHQGQSAMYFTISHPGRYELAISDVTPNSITDAAVGPGGGPQAIPGPGILGPAGPPGSHPGALLILAGALVLAPAGALTATLTAARRRRASSAMAPAPAATATAGGWTGQAPAQLIPPGPAPQLASRNVTGRRAGAALIDIVLMTGLLMAMSAAAGQFSLGAGGLEFSVTGWWALMYFALVLLYFFTFEAAAGQTVGKLLLGLRVVGTDGSRPSAGAIAGRTLLRIIDGLPLFYLAGFITILATGQRRQRLGDLAAATAVIRARP